MIGYGTRCWEQDTLGRSGKDEFVTCSYRAMLGERARMKLIGAISSSHNMFAQQKQIQRRNNHLVIKPSSGPGKVESEIVKWKCSRGKWFPDSQVCLCRWLTRLAKEFWHWKKHKKVLVACKWICNQCFNFFYLKRKWTVTLLKSS